ncbi:MAG TPA: SPASM domain-containing protein [Bacteriovoracaceae bacterium]|nr:SPASM domain-containing protein [Bacteriovoracaceae bacterium]
MRFFRSYIEISNICNLQCSFCPEVERPKKILSSEIFEDILLQVLPHSEQICLHLMGEPLSHPEFKKILEICDKHRAQIHLTTNGTLLNHYDFNTFFKSTSLRQINFSLHSFKDNFPERDFSAYLFDILEFSKQALEAKPELYINYRLWNLPDPTLIQLENKDIIDEVCNFFSIPINERVDVGFKKSKNLTGRIYFHFDTRFRWPTLEDPHRSHKGFCHGLSQQIGIHADGAVVPCCLDKEAVINLGNIFEQSFQEIIEGERAQKILRGFQKRELVEELCQKCTFITRFDKKTLDLRKKYG